MKQHLAIVFALWLCAGYANAVDWCYGHHDPGNPFLCGQYGNCTWWAYKKASPALRAALDDYGSGRDAWVWHGIAERYNLPHGTEPRAGAIAVFSRCSSIPHGHVAYVERVNTNGSFNVSHMDWFGTFGSGLQRHTYTTSSLCGISTFIYGDGVSLETPSDNARLSSPGSVMLGWNSPQHYNEHRYIVSTDESFIRGLTQDGSWSCDNLAPGRTCSTGTTGANRGAVLNNSLLLAPGQRLYWRVRAASTGYANLVSEVQSFTFPVAVSQLLPAHNAQIESVAVTLTWNSQGAENHRYIISTDEAYLQRLPVEGETHTLWSCSGLSTQTCQAAAVGRDMSVTLRDDQFLRPGQTYYWRVRAANGEVGSTVTAIRQFTVRNQSQPIPDAPTDISDREQGSFVLAPLVTQADIFVNTNGRLQFDVGVASYTNREHANILISFFDANHRQIWSRSYTGTALQQQTGGFPGAGHFTDSRGETIRQNLLSVRDTAPASVQIDNIAYARIYLRNSSACGVFGEESVACRNYSAFLANISDAHLGSANSLIPGNPRHIIIDTQRRFPARSDLVSIPATPNPVPVYRNLEHARQLSARDQGSFALSPLVTQADISFDQSGRMRINVGVATYTNRDDAVITVSLFDINHRRIWGQNFTGNALQQQTGGFSGAGHFIDNQGQRVDQNLLIISELAPSSISPGSDVSYARVYFRNNNACDLFGEQSVACGGYSAYLANIHPDRLGRGNTLNPGDTRRIFIGAN